VLCYLGDLNQVFLNLLVNAAHAIKETGRRGTITVTTAQDGDDAVIRIADTGHGIPESIRQKVFEPFFTTKQVGEGTGQGLALARSVVHDRHGGEISFDSQVDRGTAFTIRLPVQGRPSAKQPDAVGA
jgi:signal transduction histidine kinase